MFLGKRTYPNPRQGATIEPSIGLGSPITVDFGESALFFGTTKVRRVGFQVTNFGGSDEIVRLIRSLQEQAIIP